MQRGPDRGERGRKSVERQVTEADAKDPAACVGEELMARARKVEWWSCWMAECYAFIDEQDLALDWLENAVERGFINYPFLANHSKIFRTLDGNPRFGELLSRVRTAWEQFEP